ncbi:MAG: hypothetical protein HKN82_07510, partial [Akkermansiaceae bacterium]|nr:hypothetical protein [Akkermansiaceae bacterium]
MEAKHKLRTEARPETARLCQEHDVDLGTMWEGMRREAAEIAAGEPELRILLEEVILDAPCLGTALGRR